MDYEDTFWTAKDLEAVTHQKEQTWRKRRWRGDGPSYVKIGNRCLYPRKTTLAWIESHLVCSTSQDRRAK